MNINARCLPLVLYSGNCLPINSKAFSFCVWTNSFIDSRAEPRKVGTLFYLTNVAGHYPSTRLTCTWSDNKVRDLIAVKVLHTSLLNTTVVSFKVLPLGSYAPMLTPSPPFKTILEMVLWNGLQTCRCITPDVINVIKMPSFQYFLYLREQKKVTGGWIRWIGRVFQHSYLFSS